MYNPGYQEKLGSTYNYIFSFFGAVCSFCDNEDNIH